MKITVTKAEGEKCARCWRIVPALSIEPSYGDICERCVIAVLNNKLVTLIRGIKILQDAIKSGEEDITDAVRRCNNALAIVEGEPSE